MDIGFASKVDAAFVNENAQRAPADHTQCFSRYSTMRLPQWAPRAKDAPSNPPSGTAYKHDPIAAFETPHSLQESICGSARWSPDPHPAMATASRPWHPKPTLRTVLPDCSPICEQIRLPMAQHHRPSTKHSHLEPSPRPPGAWRHALSTAIVRPQQFRPLEALVVHSTESKRELEHPGSTIQLTLSEYVGDSESPLLPQVLYPPMRRGPANAATLSEKHHRRLSAIDHGTQPRNVSRVTNCFPPENSTLAPLSALLLLESI